MPPIDRRGFLAGASIGGLLLGGGCAAPAFSPSLSRAFSHGVASGDPEPRRVVIWTRFSPEQEVDDIEWLVARDRALRRVVRRGTVGATADTDFCCKVDVDGLEPGSRYFYAFRRQGEQSDLGATRTLPEGSVAAVRFAVASCANYQQGAFSAYGHIARQTNLDAVLHLGDYIYEYGDLTDGRVPLDPPHEILTLQDYRRRYAFYRRDAALQACHREHPFIAVWDDHESANNAWSGGANNHDAATEGDWAARRAAAVRAWHEWMPVRETATATSIHRSFRFGDLLDLVMLDTRLEGRDAPASSPRRIADHPDRELLGPSQERWLLDQLDQSQARGARWRFVGQQVVFSPLGNFNPDQWDGYPLARKRILDHLRRAAIDNVVMLTGDIHSAWAMDVAANPYDPAFYDASSGRGSQAVEFVTPGIASEPLGSYLLRRDPERYRQVVDGVGKQPHLHFADYMNRGFMIVDIDQQRVDAAWHFVQTPDDPHSAATLAHRESVRAGQNCLSGKTGVA